MTAEDAVVGLLRHGATEFNEAGRIQGWADSPLTPAGAAEVRGWVPAIARLDFDRITASDLGRAMATAEIINRALQLPLDAEPDLREQNWGRWTGEVVADMGPEDARELEDQIQKGWNFRPPGGESRREVLARALRAVQRRAEPGRRVLLVAHEGVVKCLVYHLSGRAFLPSEAKLLQGRNRLHLLRLNPEPEILHLNVAL